MWAQGGNEIQTEDQGISTLERALKDSQLRAGVECGSRCFDPRPAMWQLWKTNEIQGIEVNSFTHHLSAFIQKTVVFKKKKT